MAVLGVIVVYIFIIGLEAYPIYKYKKWKEFFLYLGVISVAFIINLILSLGISISSPVEPIKTIITGIFGK